VHASGDVIETDATKYRYAIPMVRAKVSDFVSSTFDVVEGEVCIAALRLLQHGHINAAVA